MHTCCGANRLDLQPCAIFLLNLGSYHNTSVSVFSGHIPIVYVDGEPLIESFAVLRKISKQVGEYGKNDDHDYLVDMVADSVAEFRCVCTSLG